jgi:hypothetical protein
VVAKEGTDSLGAGSAANSATAEATAEWGVEEGCLVDVGGCAREQEEQECERVNSNLGLKLAGSRPLICAQWRRRRRRRRRRRLRRARGARRLRAEEWEQRFVSAQTGDDVEQGV